jgi:hypothetical protein
MESTDCDRVEEAPWAPPTPVGLARDLQRAAEQSCIARGLPDGPVSTREVLDRVHRSLSLDW